MLTKNIQKDCNVWPFQCNPKKYKIEAALNDAQINECFHWQVKQHKQYITKGDIAVIWCSGQSAGIFAIAEILSNPELQVETKHESKYWIDDTEERGCPDSSEVEIRNEFNEHYGVPKNNASNTRASANENTSDDKGNEF